MALTFQVAYSLTQQDLGNILGVASTQAALQLAASQTNQPLTGTLYTGAASPFLGMSLLYTSSTDAAGNTVTLSLATGHRSGYNARRLAMILDRAQNFLSSGFLPNSAPNGQVTETL